MILNTKTFCADVRVGHCTKNCQWFGVVQYLADVSSCLFVQVVDELRQLQVVSGQYFLPAVQVLGHIHPSVHTSGKS